MSPVWILVWAGLVTAALTAAWVVQDTGICPPTDSEHHLFNAILYARTMHLGGLPALWDLLRTTYVGWPPASYLLLYGPLAWAISDNAHMVRIYGVMLIPIIMWCTYSLSLRFGSRRDGALAALLTLVTFGISGQMRQVSIDLPATAAVLLVLVSMLSTRHFQKTGATLLFGAAMGLCLFTRVQANFFLVGPLVLWTVTALMRAGSVRAGLSVITRLFLAALVALAVSSTWWAGHLTSLWHISTSHMDPTQVQPRGDPSFWAGLGYYLLSLGRLCGWPMVAAPLALLQVLTRQPPPRAALRAENGSRGCRRKSVSTSMRPATKTTPSRNQPITRSTGSGSLRRRPSPSSRSSAVARPMRCARSSGLTAQRLSVLTSIAPTSAS